MNRTKKKLKRYKRNKIELPEISNCPNCGNPGPHFIPASLGDKGFFTCEKVEEKEVEK